MRTERIIVENNGERLDAFLANYLELSRSAATKIIDNGNAKINGEVAKKRTILKQNWVLDITIPDPETYDAQAENIPLDIVYEDEYLLVVNKPKGMVVHPAPGNYTGTLVNALLFHCRDSLSGINGVMRPGILHRIDKDTSGLLLVAKNDMAHLFLAEQIKEHTLTREYEAVVYGNVKTDKGVVDEPIGRHPVERKKMAVVYKNSKEAVTNFEVLNRFQGFTHMKFALKTGRTHQIRVHMAFLGHPIAGDAVYGPKKVITELQGQCLHAKKIGFIHPFSKEYMEFDSELPDYFKSFIKNRG